MTLFQHGVVDTTSGRTVPATGIPGQSDQSETHAQRTDPARSVRDAGAGDGPVSGPVPDTAANLWAAIIDRLFPQASPAERERLGSRLAEQAAGRLAYNWQAMTGDRPALPGIALIAPDAGMALQALALSLTLPAALLLLSGEPTGPAMIALSGPVIAARESALDAMESSLALKQFDQVCGTVCKAHLAELLERLTPADRETFGPVPDRGDDEVLARPVVPYPAPTHHTATEPALLAALRLGDNQYAIRLLAAAALVPTESIETAISLRSRRGLVSLAWKAGFSMRAAVLLQTELGGFPPSAVLTATSDGGCPLNRSEMVWQIGFLARKLI